MTTEPGYKAYLPKKFRRHMKHPTWIYVIFVIGLAALTIRLLLDSEFRNSALLYVAVPYVLSVLLHQTIKRAPKDSIWRRYWNHFLTATVVMLATSVLLFEGFICVLMFMPIYYFFMTLAFLVEHYRDRAKRKGNVKIGTYGVAAVVAIVSLEGVSDELSFGRDNEVTYKKTVSQSISSLKANLALPIALDGRRGWFLSIFPLPTRIDAGSLKSGDVHNVAFTYKRWFTTNIHQGVLRLEISEVGDDYVRTTVLDDTSYLSGYLTIRGTEIRFQEFETGDTEVSLTIKYTRLLDPYWYFAPLQKYAIEKSAKYLIENVIERSAGDG